jgi:hypothetical protein
MQPALPDVSDPGFARTERSLPEEYRPMRDFIREPDRVNFGNMLTHGVDAIWNGGAYQRFRDQLSSDEPSSLCRSCSLYRGTF